MKQKDPEFKENCYPLRENRESYKHEARACGFNENI